MSAATVPPPSTSVAGETVEKAVKALLKWKDCQPQSQKPQLLSSDDFVYLVVTLKKMPSQARTNPCKILLKHPLLSPATDGSEFCLFLDDRPDRRPSSKDAKAKIASESIPLTKVIKLSKLKTDYKPYEAKRKLCDSYDLFLADRRIIPLLPKHIGKHFYKKKKIPLAMDLEHQNWKEQLERVCSSALLHLNAGTCSTIKVARTSMSPGDIVQNVVAAINGVAETVPENWKNIRSLNLKLSGSLALPIYQSLPEANLKLDNLPEANLKAIGLLEEASVAAVAVEGKKRGREQGEDDMSSIKKKSSSKKGRIHQVRYMDDAIDKLVSDGEEEQDAVDGEKKGDELDVDDTVGRVEEEIRAPLKNSAKTRKALRLKAKGKKEASNVELGEPEEAKMKKEKRKKEASKVELGEPEEAKMKKEKRRKETSEVELGEPEGAKMKKEKRKKEASKVELGEAVGAKMKKEKRKKEASKAELGEADGVKMKKEKVKKEASKVELGETNGVKMKKEKVKKEASKVELGEADGAKMTKEKAKKEASKVELGESDGANMKKEKKVRKISNVAKPSSAKKSKRT